jgi:hypothetical protein
VITILLITILAVIILAAAATAWYFLVVLPSRWHLPYEMALPLLDSDDRDDLERADHLLGQALNAGPRGRMLGRIRFAQAYTRAMLGSYDKERCGAAAAILEELILAEGRTAHTAYLELWLQSRLENHSRTADLYAEHSVLLGGYPASGRIAAASHLHLAAGNWRRREVNAALHHFDKVQEIGELTDKIPPEANDLQLANGVQSVFDGRSEDARESFTLARDRAEQRNASALEADLGLLVCDWDNGGPGDLGGRLKKMAGEAGQRSGGEATTKLLRRGIALLLLLVQLREWLGRPSQSGAPSPEDFEEFTRRVSAVREADPDFGDADLIDGLVRYYFASNQPDREDALGTLERAQAITLPEARRLVERERELGGEGHAISRFLKLIDDFLEDPDRSEEERERLWALRAKVIQNSGADDIADGPMPDQRTQEEDYRRRVKEIRRQVELISYTSLRDLPDDHPVKQAHRRRMSELDRAGDTHADSTQTLHKVEQDLMVSVSQYLLLEESK